MAAKKIVIVNLVVIAALTLLVIASLPFANNLVELGFLTGVSGRKLFYIPLSGGLGVGVANLVPIVGWLLVIGAATHALTGIPWANSSTETEGKND